MEKTNAYLIALYEPLSLSIDEIEDPMEVLIDFFRTFSLEHVREIFFQTFTSTICQGDDFFGEDPEARANLVWEWCIFEKALEAAYLVSEGIGTDNNNEDPENPDTL